MAEVCFQPVVEYVDGVPVIKSKPAVRDSDRKIIPDPTWVDFLTRAKKGEFLCRQGVAMPEIRYYTVTQEREVKVWANSPVDAATIADGKFNNYTPSQIEGAATSEVRDRDLIVREDY